MCPCLQTMCCHFQRPSDEESADAVSYEDRSRSGERVFDTPRVRSLK